MLESGDAMLSVQDRGIGMSAARIAELNQRIADPHAYESPKPASKTKAKTKAKSKQPLTDEPGKQAATTDGEGDGLGLRVAALLATRHGVEITLREHQQGGIAAVVVLPQALLPTARPVTAPLRVASAGAAPVLTLPGSVAEANSNALPGRSDREPLVAAPEESAGDPYAIGPDTHERVADAADDAADDATDEATDDAADEATDEAADGATDAAEAPAVSVPETEEADRTDVTAGTDEAQPPAETSTEPVTDAVTPAVTDKGLPKRTPKAVKSASTTADRTGSVDADALRRRLGGFHRGAKAGKRDADAELLEQTEVQQKQSSSVPRQTEAAEGTDARTNETGKLSRRHAVDGDRHIRTE